MTTQPYSEKYPWHRTRAGESFFVPALDVNVTIREGMHAASLFYGSLAGIRVRPAIYNGLLGVMFKKR